MIKHLLLSFVLLVAPSMAFAQSKDRDVLLTPEGTLYTIESVFPKAAADTALSGEYLALTIQQGEKISTSLVPASLAGGLHTSPALAYDADSQTLFIFWEQAVDLRQRTSLLFCSYQNGKFGAPTELDAGNWRLRHNLRIGVTRKTEDRDAKAFVNELTVHAIWWEETGYGEWARYAMLAIDKGIVSQVTIRNLANFVDSRNTLLYSTTDHFNTDVLRHPQIFESNTHDSVDVVFGDLATSSLHRVTLKPVVQGRLRIPIGVRDQALPSPRFQGDSVGAEASEMSAISGDGNRLVFFYGTAGGQIKYALYKDQDWTAVRSISLSGAVTRDVAINALRRMLASE